MLLVCVTELLGKGGKNVAGGIHAILSLSTRVILCLMYFCHSAGSPLSKCIHYHWLPFGFQHATEVLLIRCAYTEIIFLFWCVASL